MKERRHPLLSIPLYAVLIGVGFTMLLPFVWQFLTSLKPLGEVEGAGFWPRHWQPENYHEVFRQIRYGRYYINSLVIAAAVTVLQVLTSCMSAFAFSRLHWKGRDLVFLAYLGTMMIPGVVTMVPNFALMWKLGLYNTYAGLILPAAFSAFGTFLMRQFMLGIPASLDEAARIDGTTEWQLFWEIIMPLVRPAMVTLAIFTFMGNYSSFFWPLIMVKDESLRTLPIGLMYFDSSYGTETNLLMAASVMAIIPLIAVFIVFQRQIVSGLQVGAVKG
jgi:multiple sugar transport system permease protein